MSYQHLPFDASGLEELEKNGLIGSIKSDFKYPAKKYFSMLSSAFEKIKKKLFNKKPSIGLDETKKKQSMSYSR